MDLTIKSIKRNLHDINMTIGIIFLLIFSLGEIVIVFLQFGSISIYYISLQITNFLCMIGMWKLLNVILRNDVLSKKYRIIYLSLILITIFGIYVILFYPILEKNYVLDYINMFEGLISGYAIIFGLSYTSLREIEVRVRTGKTLWGIRKNDSILMSYEKFFAMFLLIIIPILFILAFIAGFFIYNFLTEYNLGSYSIRIFLTGSPVLILGFFCLLYVPSFNKKYRKRLVKVTSKLEQEKFLDSYRSKRR